MRQQEKKMNSMKVLITKVKKDMGKEKYHKDKIS